MSEYKMGDGMGPAAKQMATETWCQSNSQMVLDYIEQRVRGQQAIKTMRRVFGEEYYDSNVSARVHALESTDFFREHFDSRLRAIAMDQLWNDKISVNKILQIVNDDLEKGSTRLRAIQELNIMVGITIVDENGKTRKGNSMADFYASQKAAAETANKPKE